jgi:hypothetical protein
MSSIIPCDIGKFFYASDLFLFTGGGCHIFARALANLLSDQRYVLRAAFETKNCKPDCFHVYAYADGYLIDALGIKREQDYLDHIAGSRGVKIHTELCAEKDLFKKTGWSKDGDPAYEVNRWGLVMDDSFVAYAKARAEMLIQIEPARYQLSYLLNEKKKQKP